MQGRDADFDGKVTVADRFAITADLSQGKELDH